MDLGTRIDRAAQRQGIGIEDLRKSTGIPRSTFYRLKAGRPPRKVLTLADALVRLRRAGVVVRRADFPSIA